MDVATQPTAGKAKRSEPLSVLLSIDTEGDNLWQNEGDGRSFRNIHRLPEFQAFCDELGLRPTYLVAYEVIENDRAREVIQQLHKHGNCEIGAHLHAWLTPPYYPALESPGRQPYLHEYPAELRSAKLETMTLAIEQAIGIQPVSYRGGRWSMDAITLQGLAGLGYLSDTTVTPMLSWVTHLGAHAGGPDFTRAPRRPYHPDPGDVTRIGGSPLLEVPVSVSPTSSFARAVASAAAAAGLGGRPGAWRHWKRPLGRFLVWKPNPAQDGARRVMHVARETVRSGRPVLNIPVHSSELMAGCAPWTSTDEDEKRVWDCLRSLTDDLGGLTMWQGVALATFAQEFMADHESDVRRVQQEQTTAA